MRILHVSKLYHPWIGGVERSVQTMVEDLRNRWGLDVEVLACQPAGSGAVTSVGGVRVTLASSLGMAFGMPVSLDFPLIYRRLSRSCDIIHLHMPFPLAAFSEAVLGQNEGRVIVHYHSDIVRGRRLAWMYEPFLHRLLERADQIIVTSPNLLLNSRHLRAFRQKCRVIPLAVDVRKRRATGSARVSVLGRMLGLRKSDKTVLFVGRLSYYKGLEYLIEAMRHVDAKLIIVGDGPLRTTLQESIKSSPFRDKILFCTKVSDAELGAYYSLASVFVLPSVAPTEAFGLVQLEAMVYGVPIVNTNLPTGVPWVSRSGETGLTVPPQDSGALAEAINTILTDRALSGRFSVNCKARVKKFSVDTMVDQIYALYEEVLGVGRKKRRAVEYSPVTESVAVAGRRRRINLGDSSESEVSQVSRS